MRTKHQINNELEVLKVQLSELICMSEEQACLIHNVDEKEEIIGILQDEIDSLEIELESISLPTGYELELTGERYGYDYY